MKQGPLCQIYNLWLITLRLYQDMFRLLIIQKKEPRNVKVSPPTALAPAPARRPHRFRILLRRSAQAVGVQQRAVFKRRNGLAIRCRARQAVVVRRTRETHAGEPTI